METCERKPNGDMIWWQEIKKSTLLANEKICYKAIDDKRAHFANLNVRIVSKTHNCGRMSECLLAKKKN